MKEKILLILFLGSMLQYSSAQKSNIEISVDILHYLPFAVALGSNLKYNDGKNEQWYSGGLQLGLSVGTAIATTYALKYTIAKPRPDGSNNLSWPSGHTSNAFSGASYLQIRYGWEIGVPSYLLATYIGYSRIYANKHDIWDVIGGAIIGIGSAYLWTKPYKKENIKLSIAKQSNALGFSIIYSLQ